MEVFIIYAFIFFLAILILYLIIKYAVINGIKSALSGAKVEQSKDGAFIISVRAGTKMRKESKLEYDPLFEDTPDKSEIQKKIEKEIYILYAKRKLPIDYNDTIENQKTAIRRIADEKMRDKGIEEAI